jgi:hypothetical protein
LLQYPGALVLGLLPWGEYLSMTLKAFSTVVWTILAARGVAIFVARWERPLERLPWVGGLFLWASPFARIGLGLAKAFERIDRITAQWQKAGICLLALAAVFGIALWAG